MEPMAFKIDLYFEKKRDFVRFFDFRVLTGFPSNSFFHLIILLHLYLELKKNRARIKFVENIFCSHWKLYSYIFKSTYEREGQDLRLHPEFFNDKLS